MKFRELNQGLEGKIRLSRKENHRHTDYSFTPTSGEVVLPTVIRVSRSSGDLANRNVHNVAVALGLRETELGQMIQCSISRSCTLLALTNRLLQFVHQKHAEQGAVFAPGMLAMVESVEFILREVRTDKAARPSSDESRLMARCARELSILLNDVYVGSVAAKAHAIACGCADTE